MLTCRCSVNEHVVSNTTPSGVVIVTSVMHSRITRADRTVARVAILITPELRDFLIASVHHVDVEIELLVAIPIAAVPAGYEARHRWVSCAKPEDVEAARRGQRAAALLESVAGTEEANFHQPKITDVKHLTSGFQDPACFLLSVHLRDRLDVKVQTLM